LANSIAVVNGGAGGIGAAVVLRLARDGFRVVILDKDEAVAGRFLMSFEVVAEREISFPSI
jgi:NAD(P)-dependent dehydrogenase (short-subunit alcohol dehydrogenase family)